MSTRPGVRSTTIAGAHWRSAVVSGPAGLLIEVGAPERISARAASLRTTVIWTTVAGLAIAWSRRCSSPAERYARSRTFVARAAHISDAEDLGVRVQEPGQPTEVATLAGELDGMLARLDTAIAAREQALVAARRFAADAGHELRTPLQTIRANLDIARSPEASHDERQLALEVMTQQSERMNRLVDGLQSLARGEAGLVQSGTEVDLGDIADSAVYVTRTRHPDLSIDVDLPESGPTVTGDGDGLWRVIENLLENAARHGRPGGHITMQVAPLNGGAEILVDDDGPGIPPAERNGSCAASNAALAPPPQAADSASPSSKPKPTATAEACPWTPPNSEDSAHGSASRPVSAPAQDGVSPSRRPTARDRGYGGAELGDRMGPGGPSAVAARPDVRGDPMQNDA